MIENQAVILSDYFVYDETSPTCLRWKIDKLWKNNKRTYKGSPAGNRYTSKAGNRIACSMKVNKKTYYAHRIVWELFNGGIPDGMIIDHLDRNPWNNVIHNLYLKTQHDNMNNKSKYKTNSSGKTGVCWHTTDGGKFTYATARWVENGKERCKNFSVVKLGIMEAWRDAVEYRDLMINILNVEHGYKYTETHGQ